MRVALWVIAALAILGTLFFGLVFLSFLRIQKRFERGSAEASQKANKYFEEITSNWDFNMLNSEADSAYEARLRSLGESNLLSSWRSKIGVVASAEIPVLVAEQIHNGESLYKFHIRVSSARGIFEVVEIVSNVNSHWGLRDFTINPPLEHYLR